MIQLVEKEARGKGIVAKNRRETKIGVSASFVPDIRFPWRIPWFHSR
jgi:hypothetical protein